MHAWLIKYMTYKDMSLPHSESLHDDSTHAWRLSGMYVNSGVVEKQLVRLKLGLQVTDRCIRYWDGVGESKDRIHDCVSYVHVNTPA